MAASPTPIDIDPPRHLRKSGLPRHLPLDVEGESGRGGASGQPLPQRALRTLSVRRRGVYLRYRLGRSASFPAVWSRSTQGDSPRVARRCTMVHLTTFLCKAYRGGHLTIRLTLGGCVNRPFYRIVAVHNKCPRDGRFVEQLGSYDPLPNSNGEKLVALNLDRIRHWIGCGAHLSKPMEKLLGLSGFYPLHPMMITNAERLRRKRAREVHLASQKTESEPGETEAS